MTRQALVYGLVLVLLAGCVSVETTKDTPEPTVPSTPESAAPTSSPESTPTMEPTPEPTPTATPTPQPSPTPTSTPTPTPTPEPVSRTVTETPCCGLFDWVDDHRLLVFDRVPDGGEGSWVVDIEDGSRHHVAAGFGVVSESGLVAFPEPGQGRVTMRDLSGETAGAIANGGRIGWPSPDGTRVAWFENLPIRTPSSSVDRSVELYIGDISSGEQWNALELQAAEVHWMPDNRHLLIPARNLSFEEAGIWLVDGETGGFEVIFEEVFVQAVRLSPQGDSVAFMRTFNDDPAANGLWVMEIESRELIRVPHDGPFRWASARDHLWVLEMSGTGAGADRLLRVEIATGEIAGEVTLDGQIRNDTWSISPDGSYVAYWRVSDGQVVVESLDSGG